MGCKVSVIGSCVPRDCLRVHKEDNGYSVEKYVQAVNPVSAVSNTMLLKEFDWDYLSQETNSIIPNNFYKKMVKLDLTKQIFTYMSEVQSDFLLIDAVDSRFPMLYDKLSGRGYLTIKYPTVNDELIKDGYLPPNSVSIDLSTLSDNEFDFYMDRYVECLKNMYNEESMILFECYCVPYIVNNDRSRIDIFDYGQVTHFNYCIQRGYQALSKRLPQAHIIRFPHGIIGDEAHQWGAFSLHYIPEYYEYGLEALDLITEKRLPVVEEQRCLSELKKSYELKIKQIYEPIFVKGLQAYQQRDDLCNRMQTYEEYMKNLLMNRDNLEKIKNLIIKNYNSRCAFYGLTELSKLFIFLFKQWKIDVEYVVENSNKKEFAGIKIVKRTETSYPDVDVMIIADVKNNKKIKEKLASMDVSYPFYDVFDILK